MSPRAKGSTHHEHSGTERGRRPAGLRETNGTFKADLTQVFGSDSGRVVAMHHNSGERNGKRLDSDCCVVFEVKDGQVISAREYFFDLHNWDAFWA